MSAIDVVDAALRGRDPEHALRSFAAHVDAELTALKMKLEYALGMGGIAPGTALVAAPPALSAPPVDPTIVDSDPSLPVDIAAPPEPAHEPTPESTEEHNAG